MKKINYLLVIVAGLLFMTACNKVTYKRTQSGLVYKLFPSDSKDSLIKVGQFVKFNYTIKYNDSVMDRFNSYGKMPGYIKVQQMDRPSYDFQELITQMKKGDSLVTVQMTDTLFNLQSPLLPPNAKKGDRVTMNIKILEVFTEDSIARADFNKEMEKDKPRQEKEQQEEMAKREKEMEEQKKKELEELKKSGEVAKELKEMEQYLQGKNIKAQKTGEGTYVKIDEQGTGPAAASGKWVNVKYTGKILRTDSVFQSNSYAFQLGKGSVISGWDEGLLLFKEGGKGTLYIPGFLAYGQNPPPAFKPFEALVFDVEMLNVSDTALTPQARPPHE